MENIFYEKHAGPCRRHLVVLAAEVFNGKFAMDTDSKGLCPDWKPLSQAFLPENGTLI